MVSLSRIISFRSIDTTSPVSSSTKSSTHFLRTRAANFRPNNFFRPDLLTFTSSASSNNSRRSEEHTSELQSREKLVCRLLLEKKNATKNVTKPLKQTQTRRV